MEATLAVLNDLVAQGVIQKYAIGGAVAAIFWVEPFDTIDLDVFVFLPSFRSFPARTAPGSLLLLEVSRVRL